MAAHPILECYQKDNQAFTGVVVTDGRGSPRGGKYAKVSDEEMCTIRREEQRKAAIIGGYSAVVMLDYSSEAVKDRKNLDVVNDIVTIVKATQPGEVYTHNLADKHDTHVAVALRVITALRSLPEKSRPRRLVGCEGWRDLDWMLDADRQCFDLSEHEDLQAALLKVYDSQISGGKRYDLAALARRKVNATLTDPVNVDIVTGMAYAMDMTPLLMDPSLSPQQFVHNLIRHFSTDVADRLSRLE
ncbi:PIG-L family deacetylase [bacterium]|nr:PIG-L family deacetylase [bacterium]